MLAGREEVNDIWVQLVLWSVVAAMAVYIAMHPDLEKKEEEEPMGTKCDFCLQVIIYKPWEHIRKCSKAKQKREEAKKKLTYEERRLAHRRAEGYES